VWNFAPLSPTNFKFLIMKKLLLKSRFNYILLVSIVLLWGNRIQAQCTEPSTYQYQTSKDGDWNTADTWKDNTIPPVDGNNNILITHNVTYDGDLQLTGNGTVTIKKGSLSVDHNFKSEVSNNIILKEGTLKAIDYNNMGSVCAIDSKIISTHDFQFEPSASIKLENTALAICHDFNGQSSTSVTGSSIQLNVLEHLNRPEVFTGSTIAKWYSADGNGDQTGWPTISPTALCDCDGNGLNIAILPVTLTGFSTAIEGNTVLLRWSTANEINNAGFNIERSVSNLNWTSIGYEATKALNGNSSRSLDYSFVDKDPLNGTNLYRLRQVDLDGKQSYSNVVAAQAPTTNSIAVYPNPAASTISVKNVVAKQQIRIIGLDGKIYQAMTVTTQPQDINVSGFVAGIYFAQVWQDNKVVGIAKFVKK